MGVSDRIGRLRTRNALLEMILADLAKVMQSSDENDAKRFQVVSQELRKRRANGLFRHPVANCRQR